MILICFFIKVMLYSKCKQIIKQKLCQHKPCIALIENGLSIARLNKFTLTMKGNKICKIQNPMVIQPAGSDQIMALWEIVSYINGF
jgi:hypothetical protein